MLRWNPARFAGVIALVALLACAHAPAQEAPRDTDWPAWRGPNNSGAAESGCALVDSLDQAKLAWKSDPVGLSGCMYPAGIPGEGYCDPIIAGGRVYVYWFRRNGDDKVVMHRVAASAGMLSLVEPPENPAAFASPGGHRTSLPSKEMSAIQSHISADDIVTCLDDSTGKMLWQRVFHERGVNHVRVYSPLCEPCIRDGRMYVLGSSGRVYALDAATGKTLWENNAGKLHEEIEQRRELYAHTKARPDDFACLFNTGLVAADGVVATGDGAQEGRSDIGTVAFDGQTGQRLWTIPRTLPATAGIPNVWRHNGKEYFLTVAERMLLIEPRTGKILWETGGPKDRMSDSDAAALSGDYLVVGKNVGKTVNGDDKRPECRGPSCYKLDLTGAKRLWTLPCTEAPGISLIGPAIYREHAYVAMQSGLTCVELETGKVVGEKLPGFGGAYNGYVVADQRIFACGGPIRVGRTFPDMKKLEGTLPGTPDVGEIHTPSVASGRVYWRGRRNVWCYDFRKNPQTTPPASQPAARDLTALKDDPAQLASAVEKEGWPTRAAAAELLRALGEKARPASGTLQKVLLTAVAAKDWGDVDLLLDTLLRIDRAAVKPAVPELAKLLEDQDELAVRLGCHALGLIGPGATDAVPALGKLLDPEKPGIAAFAARTLGRIGPAAGAAVPALLKCLEAKDSNLKFQTAKALCHMAPADPAARAAAIDAVLADPLFIRAAGGAYPPRLTSYKALALSLLGPAALPQLLERATKVVTVVSVKGSRAPEPPYSYVPELATASFLIDPKSAPDFLPLLAKIPRTNPPKVDGGLLAALEKDFQGAQWNLNPADIVVRSKSKPPAGKPATGKPATDKPATDE